MASCADVFNAAVEQPPDERAAFLERSCDGDEALRRKVELLLKYHDTSGDFIKSPAFEAAPELLADDPATLIGQTPRLLSSGRRRRCRRDGRSLSRDWDERLGRKVALKLLPMRFTGDAERLKRFQQEARAVSGSIIQTS